MDHEVVLLVFPLSVTMDSSDVFLCVCVCDTITSGVQVQHIFGGNRPPKSLDPMPGITIPVGNSSAEVRAAVRCINDYLGRQIPAIVGNVTRQHRGQLLHNVGTFYKQFKAAVVLHPQNATADDALSECHRSIDRWQTYKLKIQGLRIIYHTRTWVEDFISSQPSCD